MTKIRPATNPDLHQWAALRQQLWPQSTIAEHRQDIAKDLAHPERGCLLALNDDQLVGFIELSLRSVVDGCDSSPVAYIEGWYVKAESRGNGIGKKLVQAAEKWARGQGCTEVGSDAEIHNHLSTTVHKALGFEEVGRVVQFRKALF